MKKLFLTYALSTFFTANLTMAADSWKITRPQWTTQDEDSFGVFVQNLGRAVEKRNCFTVDGCMRSPANPFSYSDPWSARFRADCADLPYFLRAYFAWKNGLPMSVESRVSPRGGGGGDIRYTPYGNYVTGRYDITQSWWGTPDALNSINKVIDMTSSASFRVLGDQDGSLFSDYYPVALGREGIRPGTVIYDPNGHVAIIYKVTDDGRIYYIDSHPDNSLTSGMYSPKFVRSYPYQGAGFKRFRPLTLVGASRNSWGEYVGGRIIGARNFELSDYSLEQFYGNKPDPGGDWQRGKFEYRGNFYNYYQYLRIVLALGELKIDPIQDLKANLADICGSIKDRVVAVSAAIVAGVQWHQHPYRLPYNIYGASGEWESYATPSRDARLKVSFMDLISQSQQIIYRWKSGDPAIVYRGNNLAQDLLSTYLQESQSCQFYYKNSRGTPILLNLEETRRRLFDLSFDPYHCAELRWGASSSQELVTCQDDSVKREWYRRERWLRFQWERRYDARMDYSLDELTGPKPGAGILYPPDVDIIGYLRRAAGNLLADDEKNEFFTLQFDGSDEGR